MANRTLLEVDTTYQNCWVSNKSLTSHCPSPYPVIRWKMSMIYYSWQNTMALILRSLCSYVLCRRTSCVHLRRVYTK